MVKITDYASLSAAVCDHTTRDDLADPMPRFVQMAEGAMKRRLRSLDMEVTVEGTVADGEIAVPAGLLSVQNLQVDAPEGISEAAYRHSGSSILVSDELDGSTVLLTYVAAFTPLEDGTTNWLIEQHPDVYFYGTLSQAYAHFRDMEGMAVSEAAFRNALEEVARSRNADRWGGGALAPSPVQQVRGGRC